MEHLTGTGENMLMVTNISFNPGNVEFKAFILNRFKISTAT